MTILMQQNCLDMIEVYQRRSMFGLKSSITKCCKRNSSREFDDVRSILTQSNMIENSRNWLPFVLPDGSLFYVVLSTNGAANQMEHKFSQKSFKDNDKASSGKQLEGSSTNNNCNCIKCDECLKRQNFYQTSERHPYEYQSTSKLFCEDENILNIQECSNCGVDTMRLRLQEKNELSKNIACGHSETSSLSDASTCSTSSLKSSSDKRSKTVRFSHRIRRVKLGLNFWTK